jgi:putative membrane protein
MGSVMTQSDPPSRNYLLASAYLVWAGALAWLLVTGRYQDFLRPGFWALLLWGLVVLVLLGGALVLFPRSLDSMSRGAALWIRLGVLIVPLIYVFAEQGRPLGSQALKNRFFEPRFMERLARSVPKQVETENPHVTLLEILQNFQAYQGRKITTEGMVHRDEVVPPKHFLVFRFLIFCCAADALPAGALVSGKDADSFAQDSWVRVEGVLGLKKVGDLLFPLIQADRITKISPPKNPYLFPRRF